ncbi:MAG: FAD binding domain-containing protein [Eubacteriales bacterium]|nr:FAD binding domain-containing protein [Eubacteriales bacterium]
MYSYSNYVRAASLDEAYELCQKKNNVVLGGALWLRMQTRTFGTAIDLSDLGLDKIEENDENFIIGAYVSLRDLERHVGFNAFTGGAAAEAVKHIVGVQFRNCATVGGSIFGRFGFSDVYTLFYALNARVRLYKAGEIGLDEFAGRPKNERDILTHIIVPKSACKQPAEIAAAERPYVEAAERVEGDQAADRFASRIVYLSQRNNSTDFPVLACAVSVLENAEAGNGAEDTAISKSGGAACLRAVIGATPYLAQCVDDTEGIVDTAQLLTGDLSDEEMLAQASAFAEYVAEHIRFDSNMRAGAAYRKHVCQVLVRRAVQSLRKCEAAHSSAPKIDLNSSAEVKSKISPDAIFDLSSAEEVK